MPPLFSTISTFDVVYIKKTFTTIISINQSINQSQLPEINDYWQDS